MLPVYMYAAVLAAPLQAFAVSSDTLDEGMRRYASAARAFRSVQLTFVRTYSGNVPSQYQVLLRRDGTQLDIYESDENASLVNNSGQVPVYRQRAVLAKDQLLIYTPSKNKRGEGIANVEYLDQDQVEAKSRQILMRYLDYGVALIGILPGDPPGDIEDFQASRNYTLISGSREGDDGSEWFCVRVEKEPFTYDLWLDPGVDYQPREIRMHGIRASEDSSTTTEVNITKIEYKLQESTWVPAGAKIAVSHNVTTGQLYQSEFEVAVQGVEYDPSFKAIRGAFVMDVDGSKTLAASFDAPQVPLKLINGKAVPAVDAGMKQSIDSTIEDIRSGTYNKRVSDPTDPFGATPSVIGGTWTTYIGVAGIFVALALGAWYLTRLARAKACE